MAMSITFTVIYYFFKATSCPGSAAPSVCPGRSRKLRLTCEQTITMAMSITFTLLILFRAKSSVDLDIVAGRSPISVAAAAIYMASQASDDKKTQREIADIAGVADVTIRQSYKLMLPRAAELFPKEFRFTTNIENLPQS